MPLISSPLPPQTLAQGHCLKPVISLRACMAIKRPGRDEVMEKGKRESNEGGCHEQDMELIGTLLGHMSQVMTRAM